MLANRELVLCEAVMFVSISALSKLLQALIGSLSFAVHTESSGSKWHQN